MTHYPRIAVLLALAAVLLLSASTARAELLLYYDFEGDVGTTINNQGSLLTDGTLGGSDATAAGPAGGFTPTTARTFDGSSTRIDTLIGADTMDVHLSNNYTMAAWLRPLSNSGDHMVFGQPSGNGRLHSGTRNNQYHLGHWGNDLSGGAVDGIPLGNWRHVTWSYANGLEQIFVNGSSVVGPEVRGQLNHLQDIWVGSSENAYFQGDLDDVVIYREALAANQVAHLAAGGDPTALPAAPAVFASNFGAASDLQGWAVLNGGAHINTGDGGGMTPANTGGGFGHDGAHETFLVQSPELKFVGQTLDGTNALVVTFAGGAGDQDTLGVIYNTPAEVVAAHGGNSFSTGQKGLAFYNTATETYDATIFENDNGGTNTRSFTPADLAALGVDPAGTYRLHYFENDDGGWGWGQVNSLQIAAQRLLGPPPEGGPGYFGIREVKNNGTIASLADAENSLQSGGGNIFDGPATTINFVDPDNAGGGGHLGGDSPYLSNTYGTDDNDVVQYAQGRIRIEDPGTYTFYARGDDGFGLRIENQNFTSVSDNGDGTAVIAGDTMLNDSTGGNVNGFGVIDLAARDYKIEYMFFERAGGAYNELFAAKGAKTAFDSDFILVGQREEIKTAGIIQPGGWDVVAIYDGAGNLAAAIEDVEDYWNNNNGTNVFTATASTINYEDPDNDGGGHGFPKIPFPGENPGADDGNFAVGALAKLRIDDPGTYTFMILGDDGSRFRLLGTDALNWTATGGSTPHDVLDDGFQLNGCCSDGFGIVEDLPAGTYDVELIWNEMGGGAYVGLWGAFGYHSTFDANVFQLLGENIREVITPAGLQLVGVPEPSTFVLAAIGLLGLLAWRRRRSRRA